MGFREHLEAVVSSVSGSVACSLVGFDGIAVDTHQPEARAADAAAIDLNAALTEYGNLLSQLKSTALTLKTGAIGEMSADKHPFTTGVLTYPIRAYRSLPIPCANNLPYQKFSPDLTVPSGLDSCNYAGQSYSQLQVPPAPKCCAATGTPGC